MSLHDVLQTQLANNVQRIYHRRPITSHNVGYGHHRVTGKQYLILLDVDSDQVRGVTRQMYELHGSVTQAQSHFLVKGDGR